MTESLNFSAYGNYHSEKGPVTLRKAIYLAILCSLPSMAEARARDEVMSGAYRCATVPDSRQWLDCYYGAAQPQRSQLNLPPALPSQLRLASSPPGNGLVLNGDTRSRVMQEASRCYDIQDDRQWLDCYYNAAGSMRLVLGLVARATKAMPSQAPDIDAAQAAKFTKIVSRMESFSFDRSRNFTATLSNGQVWQQISGDTSYAHWNKPAGSYVAIITHGAFGSTNFQVQGVGQVFKVQRVK